MITKDCQFYGILSKRAVEGGKNMNPEIFTISAQELVNKSILIAQEHKNPTVQPLHTLAAGLENEFCISFFNCMKCKYQKSCRQLWRQSSTSYQWLRVGQLSSDFTLEDFLKECQKEAQSPWRFIRES